MSRETETEWVSKWGPEVNYNCNAFIVNWKCEEFLAWITSIVKKSFL